MAINHSPNQYNRAIKIAYGKYYPLNGNNFLRKISIGIVNFNYQLKLK